MPLPKHDQVYIEIQIWGWTKLQLHNSITKLTEHKIVNILSTTYAPQYTMTTTRGHAVLHTVHSTIQLKLEYKAARRSEPTARCYAQLTVTIVSIVTLTCHISSIFMSKLCALINSISQDIVTLLCRMFHLEYQPICQFPRELDDVIRKANGEFISSMYCFPDHRW